MQLGKNDILDLTERERIEPIAIPNLFDGFRHRQLQMTVIVQEVTDEGESGTSNHDMPRYGLVVLDSM